MKVEEIKERTGGWNGLPAWACILLFMLLFFAFYALYGFVARWMLDLFLGDGEQRSVLGHIAMRVSMLLAVLSAVGLQLCVIERRPFSDLGLSVKRHAKGLWYGLLMAVLLYVVGFGSSFLLGEVEVTGIQFDPYGLFTTFVICLLIALTEEIMSRGYILGRMLRTRINKFLALFISAAMFVVMHLFNPNLAVLPLLNLLLAGMLLGSSFLYVRNLCFPISLHLFWNWIQGPILGYQVSGMDLGSSVLTLRLPEETVWNGGAFGFEGSLICTILMIVCIILIVWWGEKRDAINLAVPQS